MAGMFSDTIPRTLQIQERINWKWIFTTTTGP